MGCSAFEDMQTLARCESRYNAILQIGAGGMANVYAGVQHGPLGAQRLVVIKQVREEIVDDPEYRHMFMDEARIAMRLNHPNVVHTYDVFHGADKYGLIMEFLEGRSLLEVLTDVGRDHLPLNEHIWILTQLLAGLQYAHELTDLDGAPLNIVHRDVTPSNVFVCYDGTVKLLDFGIAKGEGALAATQEGILKGKIGYVAPERFLSYPARPQSDIYSVGVMLWEALARGRRRFGETLGAQVNARIEGREPPIERIWPEVPPCLAAITGRALQVNPSDRYASASEFQRDLERYLVSTGSTVGPESVGRLMTLHFEEERAAFREAIEAGMVGRGVPPDLREQTLPKRSPEAGRVRRESGFSRKIPGRDRDALETEATTEYAGTGDRDRTRVATVHGRATRILERVRAHGAWAYRRAPRWGMAAACLAPLAGAALGLLAAGASEPLEDRMQPASRVAQYNARAEPAPDTRAARAKKSEATAPSTPRSTPPSNPADPSGESLITKSRDALHTRAETSEPRTDGPPVPPRVVEPSGAMMSPAPGSRSGPAMQTTSSSLPAAEATEASKPTKVRDSNVAHAASPNGATGPVAPEEAVSATPAAPAASKSKTRSAPRSAVARQARRRAHKRHALRAHRREADKAKLTTKAPQPAGAVPRTDTGARAPANASTRRGQTLPTIIVTNPYDL